MRRGAAIAVALGLAACEPPLERERAEIDAPRVLAVVAEPPEVRPGEEVELTAVIAAPGGPPSGLELAWAWCRARRPVADLAPVAQACLDDADVRDEVGRGDAVPARVPDDACARFGSEPPPSPDGTAPRPVDPDASGGYYQPVHVSGGPGLVAIGFVRVRCALAGASADQSRRFAAEYEPNRNPVLELAAAPAGGGLALAIELAGPAERFLVLPPGGADLTRQDERLRVEWATDRGRVERDDDGTATWTAPRPADGASWIWAVLRDDRGGVAARTIELVDGALP